MESPVAECFGAARPGGSPRRWTSQGRPVLKKGDPKIQGKLSSLSLRWQCLGVYTIFRHEHVGKLTCSETVHVQGTWRGVFRAGVINDDDRPATAMHSTRVAAAM